MDISKEIIQSLQEKILTFYKEKGRHDLPWRKTTNRYFIFVSEIMLQQTQVDRVIPKYNEWIKKFPTPHALAHALLQEVLTTWSGLGYNSRGKRLQDAAKIIEEQYNGITPDDPEELIKLPGIGPYTAKSICIFADNKDVATVDTNIRRILIHELKLKEETSDKELFNIAEIILPKGKSRDWHNALMDYGATYLTARRSGIKPKTKQSKFIGSKREIRGAIMKLLSKEDKLKKDNLKEVIEEYLGHSVDHDVKSICLDLEQEGLIMFKKNYLLVQ